MTEFQFKSGVPVFDQIKAYFERLIINNILKPEEKLPAVRETAKQFSINPTTVQKAYQQLEAEGFVYSLPGKGSYVAKRENYLDNVRKEAMEEFKIQVKKAMDKGLSRDELIKIIEESEDISDDKV